MIAALPDWRRLYADDFAAVYVREVSTEEADRVLSNEDSRDPIHLQKYLEQLAPCRSKNK
jgi:hypothetical protein